MPAFKIFTKKALLAALVAAFAACRHLPIEAPPEPPPAEKLTFLALGDSYTIGQSVAEAERWPNQLADSLLAAGLAFEKPKIIARTGWRTDDLANEIARQTTTGELDTAAFALVALLIGVNDQYQNRTEKDYRPRFEDLLGMAIERAGGRTERVIVLSIPDYAFTPFGNGSAAISAEIDLFNAENRAATLARGVRYFDVTAISRKGLAEPALVAADKLHPSGEQYRRWVASFWRNVFSIF